MNMKPTQRKIITEREVLMWYEHLDLAVPEAFQYFVVNEAINYLILPRSEQTKTVTNGVKE